MEIKNLIIRDYLESLTEKNELNRIFPILLEAMGFIILSKPSEYVGLLEYGKDIVAVGTLPGKKKCRFFFELKGGNDRDITEANFNGKDGIFDSIASAVSANFSSAYPGYENLPLQIIIVHNGIVKGNVQRKLEELLVSSSKLKKDLTFDRWDIYRLTELFADNLFGPHLLTDAESTRSFNRVLVNLNMGEHVLRDFRAIIDNLLEKPVWSKGKKMPRLWQVRFETLRLIAFIVYSEAKNSDNLEIAKNYLTFMVLHFWHWILKQKLEGDRQTVAYFNKVFLLYFDVLSEYFRKTLPIAILKDGLFSEHGGRYEQIGYTARTQTYLQYLIFAIEVREFMSGRKDNEANTIITTVINNNDVSTRMLLDIHSLTIHSVMNYYINDGRLVNAKNYLTLVLDNLAYAMDHDDFIPDANNSLDNVIKFITTGVKPVYYCSSTSLLLASLLEYTAILDMEEEFVKMKKIILEKDIELGTFVPFHGKGIPAEELIKDKDNDLEEILFSRSFTEGYQSQLSLKKMFDTELTFSEFKEKICERAKEFEYDYRTDAAGYPFLRKLAHIYFRTPFFPDDWRNIQIQDNPDIADF